MRLLSFTAAFLVRGPSRCPVRLVPCCCHQPRAPDKSQRVGASPHISEFVQGYSWGFSRAVRAQNLLVCTLCHGPAAHWGPHDDFMSTQVEKWEHFLFNYHICFRVYLKMCTKHMGLKISLFTAAPFSEGPISVQEEREKEEGGKWAVVTASSPAAHVPLTTVPTCPSDQQQRWEARVATVELPTEALEPCPGSRAWVPWGRKVTHGVHHRARLWRPEGHPAARSSDVRHSIFQGRKQTESWFLCEISQLQTVCHKVMM